MVSIWGAVGVGVMVIAFLGLLSWLMVVIFKEKKKPKDNGILVNLAAHRSHGRAIGTILGITKGAGNRSIVEFGPWDVADLNKPVEPEIMPVGSRHLIELPKGTLSKEKSILFVVPVYPDALPEQLKHSPFGGALTYMIETQNIKKTYEEILKEGGRRRDALLKDLGDGEISEEVMNTLKGLFIEDIKRSIEDRRKDKHPLDTGGPDHK